MRRSALCVLAAVLLCLVLAAGQARAQTQTFYGEDVVMTRANYPTVKSSEGPVNIEAGAWQLEIVFRNPGGAKEDLTCRIFLDNALQRETSEETYNGWETSGVGWVKSSAIDPFSVNDEISFPAPGEHEVLIQLWRADETQPVTAYSFKVLAVAPSISGLQASSKVVRALGENVLTVSFTNGGNENMRQAVLSVADPGGLTITPSEVELGDVKVGESTSANFTVSSPASVTLGTAQVRFSLSFIDYAGVPHTEDVYGHIEVYRLTPTLILTVPSTVENGSTVEITATLKDPSDNNPIPNENIIITVGGTTIGTFETDTGGIARASYEVGETGSFSVGASFSGSTSYGPSSASAEFTSVPQAEFTSVSQTSLPSTSTPSSEPLPYWLLLAVVILVLLVGSVAYLAGRRMGRRPSGTQARKNRHDG